MLMKLLFIALGGATGSLARFGVGEAVLKYVPSAINFPWGTLAVNAIGGFLIGLCVHGLPRDHIYWYLIVTGFLGGFTTFSAFSLEAVTLLRSPNYIYGVMYVGLSIILALGGVLLGSMVKMNG